jgi:hypothetical protein
MGSEDFERKQADMEAEARVNYITAEQPFVRLN